MYGAMLTIILACVLMMVGLLITEHRIPTCNEDDVIVGVGSFDDGYWSEYRCEHIENV